MARICSKWIIDESHWKAYRGFLVTWCWSVSCQSCRFLWGIVKSKKRQKKKGKRKKKRGQSFLFCVLWMIRLMVWCIGKYSHSVQSALCLIPLALAFPWASNAPVAKKTLHSPRDWQLGGRDILGHLPFCTVQGEQGWCCTYSPSGTTLHWAPRSISACNASGTTAPSVTYKPGSAGHQPQWGLQFCVVPLLWDCLPSLGRRVSQCLCQGVLSSGVVRSDSCPYLLLWS